MKNPILFCLLMIIASFAGSAQEDSVVLDKNLFALTAEDLAGNRELVENTLNKKVITAAQVEQFASEAPATVYVITREQISVRGYENLLDVLEDIPEVDIQRYGSPEFNQHISLRGVAGNEKFLVLQDGVRISAPTGDTHSIGYNFSVEQAEQVEVIIGPASSLYGADAFSGVIQIITQKGNQPGAAFKASVGQYGITHNAINLRGRGEDFSYAFSGTFYHSKEPDFTRLYPEKFSWYSQEYLPKGELLTSPFFQQPQKVDFEDGERKFEMPTTSYYINANVQFKDLEINYNRHYDDYSSCGSTQSEYCVYSKEARFAYFIETLFARHVFRSRNLKWRLQSIFSFHTYQLDPQTAFVNTYTSYEPGYKMEFGKSKKWEERLQYNFSNTSNLIAGFSYEILDDLPLTGDLPTPFDFDQPADLQNQYYLGSNVIDKDGNDLSIQQDFFYLHYLNFGGYLQYQSKWGQSLHVTAGIRYDINTRYGQSLNPRLGLVWKPKREIDFKILYGEALLSPSPRKSNSHFGSFFPRTNDEGEITGLGSNFFHLSNPDLEPEKLRSLEGSFRYVLSNNLVFSANGYYTRVNNLINKFAENTEVSSFKGVDVAFIETGLNEGAAQIYGGAARLDAVFNLQNGLGFNFYAGYSYSDGNSNGGLLLFNARHKFKTGMEWIIGRFSFSPRLISRGASFGSRVDDEGNAIAVPAFSIVNLYARIRLNEEQKWQWTIFSRLNNVFDTAYFNAFIGGAEGFAQVPQRPRIWTLGVKLELKKY